MFKDFIIGESNVEVTSLDVAPSGGYIVAGCSSGVVLLFEMESSTSRFNVVILDQFVF